MEMKPNGNKDKTGRSELHYAIIDNDINKVQELLAAGADVNSKDKAGCTPLHFSAQLQSISIVELLISNGALIDCRDTHGNTPLFKAVFSYTSDGSVIKLLRTKGAHPYAENNYGQTPIGLARLIANFDVAKFFNDLPL